MFSQRLFLVAILAMAALFSVDAFTVRPTFSSTQPASSTLLESCRRNAKKEKIKRNRENMRKFSTPGRRGTSRRKVLKKALATKARQEESEFISKCFITTQGDGDDE
mmetsp:Transcript_55377/g.134491  ORF Transcript_55377/g.134491 Transcript_55377/m.134491 type:complete len:107 (-) Transcript_55377:423-743(-)